MSKEIPVFYHQSTFAHIPQYEIFNGEKKPHQDIPERAKVILQALEESNVADIYACDDTIDLTRISALHSQDYLDFLRDTSAYAAKVAKQNGNTYFAVYPSIHPYNSYAEANNNIARRGLYIFDTYTPITSTTYDSAIHSAAVATAGAKLVLTGESLVYCLTRPSGHHALHNMAGGMCYINNAAVAANYLRSESNSKIAIFDIDAHHGNGTQDIFYDDYQVLVVNIHSDPSITFPHFTGYTKEVGQGEGEGYNCNFPLPTNSTNEDYDETVVKALKIIDAFEPEYLIVSAGFDTHENDPVGKFQLTTAYYQELGKRLRSLGIPSLVVQEGGYATESLGQNVISFLKGLKS